MTHENTLARQAVGFTLFLFGLGIGGLDAHVAWLTQDGAHWLNMGAAGAFVFAGLAAMFPKFTRRLASYFQLVTSAWPGGRRRTDPPPDDDTPPPPSVKS